MMAAHKFKHLEKLSSSKREDINIFSSMSKDGLRKKCSEYGINQSCDASKKKHLPVKELRRLLSLFAKQNILGAYKLADKPTLAWH